MLQGMHTASHAVPPDAPPEVGLKAIMTLFKELDLDLDGRVTFHDLMV
jgi:hypothetical protein